jgi:hypothetical protein
MSIKLTDGNNHITINPKQSIDLELKLNVSPYGHKWSKIGDQLYKFGIGNNIDMILVTNEQFKYLNDLHNGRNVQPE